MPRYLGVLVHYRCCLTSPLSSPPPFLLPTAGKATEADRLIEKNSNREIFQFPSRAKKRFNWFDNSSNNYPMVSSFENRREFFIFASLWWMIPFSWKQKRAIIRIDCVRFLLEWGERMRIERVKVPKKRSAIVHFPHLDPHWWVY